MLEIEDVYKSFFHRGKVIEILRGVTIRVNPGDSIAVTGSSGVGKSTLLHIMGSLERPTRGNVKFEDRNIYDLNEYELSNFRNKETVEKTFFLCPNQRLPRSGTSTSVSYFSSIICYRNSMRWRML